MHAAILFGTNSTDQGSTMDLEQKSFIHVLSRISNARPSGRHPLEFSHYQSLCTNSLDLQVNDKSFHWDRLFRPGMLRLVMNMGEFYSIPYS
jgi:hypothetical protein